MQLKLTRWYRGVPLALAVLATAATAATAGVKPATPKIIRIDNPHWQLAQQLRIDQLRKTQPALADEWQARLGAPDASVSTRSVTLDSPDPDALGYSQGSVETVATNGKVVAWFENTYHGLLTIARADDLAHPTAYVLDARLWTTPTTLQFDGDTLYANDITGVLAFDVSNPDDVSLKANFDMSCYLGNNANPTNWANHSSVVDYRVKDGYLYATLVTAGFIVYDVHNPTFPVLAASTNLVSADDNPDFKTLENQAYFNYVEVTGNTLILEGGYQSGTYPTGLLWTWDISDKSDPIHTFHLYAQPRGYAQPFQPTVPDDTNPGSMIGAITNGLNIKMTYAGDSLFVVGTRATGSMNRWGLTRFKWKDPTDFSTLQPSTGLVWSAVDDGTNGPAKQVQSFQASQDGKTVYVAFRASPDGSVDGALPSSLAGQKWDWSTFDAPTLAASYTMNRFFFDDVETLDTAFGSAPNYGNNIAYYGGNAIAAAPAGSAADAYIAGFDYLGAFGSDGAAAGHYTTGANPLDHINAFGPVSGASYYDLATTAGGDSVWWYPEGFSILDHTTGLKAGSWEVPDAADYVRHVAVTADGHYALVACGSEGLYVVDISDPTKPTQVGQWWTNATAAADARQPVTYVFVNGKTAYVQTRVRVVDAENAAADHNTLRVLDLTDATHPVEKAAFPYAVDTGDPLTTVYWDVNAITVSTAGSQPLLVVSNGQGKDDLQPYNALLGNATADFNGRPPVPGSVVLADLADPQAPTNLRNVPVTFSSGTMGSYAAMAASVAPAGSTSRYLYVAAGRRGSGFRAPQMGGLAVVDVTDPAAATVAAAYTFFPNINGALIDKVYAVRGADQVLIGFNSGGLALMDVGTDPLNPTQIVLSAEAAREVAAGYHFAQLSDDTWMVTSFSGTNLWHLVNHPDYTPPVFSGGTNDDGWLAPGCGAATCGTITAPMELRVHVTDDVGVDHVRFLAWFANPTTGPDYLWNLCGDGFLGAPGYIDLGEAVKQADDEWTLTVDPSMFDWTGLVQLQAQAFDAGGNESVSWNMGGNWYVVGLNASASAEPSTGTAPLTVQLQGAADGRQGPFTWAWDFGDGETSTEQNPTHVYTDTGSFTARLTVTDTFGNTSTALTTVRTYAPLTVVAQASAAAGEAPLAIDFTSTALGGDGTYTYDWDFGDGSAHATDKDASHTFAGAGTYTVRLTVTDGQGTTANDDHLVIVATSGALAVTVRGSPVSGAAPLDASFAADVKGGVAPYTYAWDFGDGATSTDASPSHTFATAGDYQVTVTVTDAAGSVATASLLVRPSAAEAAQASGCGCSATADTGFAASGLPFLMLLGGLALMRRRRR